MAQIWLFKRYFGSVFPGLVFCSVSVHRHSRTRTPWGPNGIVTGGLHSGGNFWVAPGGVLATPFK